MAGQGGSSASGTQQGGLDITPRPSAQKPKPPVTYWNPDLNSSDEYESPEGQRFKTFFCTVDKALYGKALGIDIVEVLRHACIQVTNVKPVDATERINCAPQVTNQLLVNDYIVKVNGKRWEGVQGFLSAVNQTEDMITFTVL